MKCEKIYAIIGLAIIVFCLSCNAWSSETNEEAAVAAANAWLALVDEGKFGESWETAAQYFKNALSKEKWEQLITAVRNPLGQMVSRELSSKTCMTSIPGAPDGEYVVIQFKTSFENKKSSTETITPMFGSDGKWRVSGYYIK